MPISSAATVRTRARKDGDSYVVNGEKTWISLADYADQFLVIAALEGDAKRHVAFSMDRMALGFHGKAIHGPGIQSGRAVRRDRLTLTTT